MNVPTGIFYVIADGLGDDPYPSLDTKTPLEYAKTPFLDHLCSLSSSQYGGMYPIHPEYVSESDTAHLSMFGHPPHTHPARGALEALGAGMALEADEVGAKCIFASISTTSDGLLRRHHFSDMDDRQGRELTKLLHGKAGDLYVRALHRHAHRLVLAFSPLPGRCTGTDPLKDDLREMASKPVDPSDCLDVESARLLNTAAEELNSRLPDGYKVLIRAPGSVKPLPPYPYKAILISRSDVVRGSAIAAGIDAPIPSIDPSVHPVDKVINHALDASKRVHGLSSYRVIVAHIKDTDVASHAGDVKEKISLIERIDKILSEISEDLFSRGWHICVTGDHRTPCHLKLHDSGPVPFVIGSGINPNRYESSIIFSERTCSDGNLGTFSSASLTPLFTAVLSEQQSQ